MIEHVGWSLVGWGLVGSFTVLTHHQWSCVACGAIKPYWSVWVVDCVLLGLFQVWNDYTLKHFDEFMIDENVVQIVHRTLFDP